MNEVCTSYGSTPSVYLSAPSHPQNRVEKLHTENAAFDRAAFADQLESEFMIVLLARALKVGAQLRFAHALQKQ